MTKSSRALVVDDDADNATFVADLVADAGYEPTIAASAAEALTALSHTTFDLMITDVRMPGMDGIELIVRAMEKEPELAVIAITAFGSLDTGLRALRAGAAEYLSKPFPPAELKEKVRRAVALRERRLEAQRMREESERLRAELEAVLKRKKP